MLVLSRQRDETIMIGDDIELTIVDIRGDKVRIGIDAPSSIAVHRKEVYEAIRKEKRRAEKEATVEGGASVWNTSGTFEEKDQMKWAEEKLNEVLISTEGDVVFTSIEEVLACLSHHKSLCRY